MFDESFADLSQDIEMTTVDSNNSTFEQFYDMFGDPSFRARLEDPTRLFEPSRSSTAHYVMMPPPRPASTRSGHSASTISLVSPEIHYNSTYPMYTLGRNRHGDYVTFILTVSPHAIEEAIKHLRVTPGLIGGIAYDDINYEGGSVPIVIEIKDDEDTLDSAVDYIQETPLVEIVDAVPTHWDPSDIHWVCTVIVCTQMLGYARSYLETVPGGYSGTSLEAWKIPGRQGATVKILTKIHPWMLARASDYCKSAPGRIAVTFRLEV